MLAAFHLLLLLLSLSSFLFFFLFFFIFFFFFLFFFFCPPPPPFFPFPFFSFLFFLSFFSLSFLLSLVFFFFFFFFSFWFLADGFQEPGFSFDHLEEHPRKDLEFAGVLRVTLPDTLEALQAGPVEAEVLARGLRRPNGIGFTANGQHLVVSTPDGWVQFDVDAQGHLHNQQPFGPSRAQLAQEFPGQLGRA